MSDPGDFNIDQYPYMFQLVSGRVLYAGEVHHPNVPVKTRELQTSGEGLWVNIVSMPDPIRGGSAVMFQPDLILKGGGENEDGSVQGIDLVYRFNAAAASPAWEQIKSLNHPRDNFHFVALPDRSVLAVGGVLEYEQVPVLVPEILKKPEASQVNSVNPDEVWQDMAPLDHIREWHSTALLLPDARVLVAGGNPAYADAQIYSPPYLFVSGGGPAARPEIEEATSACIGNVVYYGGSFTIITPQSAAVTQVNLIRPGSDTHSFDQDQRLVPLTYATAGPKTLNVTSPANGNVAPPGYYMLFIVANGVPSVAKWVHVEGLTTANDCNANGKNDMCDIADHTSPDCDKDNFIDTPAGCDTDIGPTVHESSSPLCMHSLWRKENNVIRQTFACDLNASQLPTTGQLQIHEMLPDGAYGGDLSEDFTFSIDPQNARTLLIRENGEVLEHRKWYALTNSDTSFPPASTWPGFEPFLVQFLVQRGDANDNGIVLAQDASLVNAAIPCTNCDLPCYIERLDMDGSCTILAQDVSIVNNHIPSPWVPKPKGHGGANCTGPGVPGQ